MPEDPWLSAYISGRSIDCPSCGRLLRAAPAGTCAECGKPLRLALGVVEPYLRWWAVLTAASAAMGGFGGFLFLLRLMRGRRHHWLEESIAAWGLVMLAAAILCLVRRPRMLRWPRHLQMALAILAVVGLVAMMVGMALAM